MFNKKTQNYHFLLESVLDPVTCFLLYSDKLNPKRQDLWQKPRRNITGDEEYWYENAAVGKDVLSNVMKQLSIDAELSKVYTNHCIRSTVVTKLDREGFEARHIMATTGHKSETSIKSYTSKCPSNKRREMSDCLADPFVNKRHKNTSSTVSKPPDENKNSDVKEEPNFELEEIDLPDDQIIAILTQIEKENAELMDEKNAEKPKDTPKKCHNLQQVQYSQYQMLQM